MPRIAILGGGISGLTAAYELELARRAGAPLDWHLFEASARLGGTVQTTRLHTPEGDYILEDGPDGWVTEKPWARELAEELGLGPEIIPCNEAERRTYIALDNQLVPMPPRMRLMVPEDLSALEGSPLFSETAKRAYADELTRAPELKAAAPTHDESVASFVRRHFGDEVLTKLAAPLLAGVFGGDVHKLSVRAVMPQFVAMERQHGSLIAALQAKAGSRVGKPIQPTFTSLRRGMGSLVEALSAQLSRERVHLTSWVRGIKLVKNFWIVQFGNKEAMIRYHDDEIVDSALCDQLLCCTPLDAVQGLLRELPAVGQIARPLLPEHASSAILAAFTWPAHIAQTFTIPTGFGFLVPPSSAAPSSPSSRPESEGRSGEICNASPQLLACTFVDQKFPHRAPTGGRVLRAFFGDCALNRKSDTTVAHQALAQLRHILGPLPDPTHTTVARWPRSLPQYEVGHLDRMAQLRSLIATTPGLHLLGNSYYGVGLPDLIRDARATARKLIESA